MSQACVESYSVLSHVQIPPTQSELTEPGPQSQDKHSKASTKEITSFVTMPAGSD